MYKFGKAVVKNSRWILIAAILLLIPAYLGMAATRINYDMLTYLPDDIDTMKGQDILTEDFGKGAFSFVIAEDLDDKTVSSLKEKIEAVPHVDSVIWYDTFADISVPDEILPDRLRQIMRSGNETVMAVFFDTSSSADETIQAVEEIRRITGRQCFVSGISALVTDLKNLCEREEPVYVGIAVLCALAAMLLLTDSYLVPFIFLAGIGITILYNLGTNVFFGEISYITKALAAVLQLAVTMDYSIFLWHSYTNRRKTEDDRNEAMALAVRDTITAVFGSSLTTIAGFLALCFMSYTMGMDIGLVMAKGCLLGVFGSITILPALILFFDKALLKTKHRSLIPDMSRIAKWIAGHFYVFIALFAVILVPALHGYRNTPVYYDFTEILSGSDIDGMSEEDLGFHIANEKLKNDFHVATTHMILADAELPAPDAVSMLEEIERVPGVRNALGLNTLTGRVVPEELIPEKYRSMLKSGKWQLMLVTSEYAVSTGECNRQIDLINGIIKRYDGNAMLIGEAPCTKDLIEITDRDFSVVALVSIAFVFLIIMFTLKSATLPVILVAVIEFAVFINLGIPYYTGFTMPFIAPICISTIQLGSTVDYAILMTTKYKEERRCSGRKESVEKALAYAMPSVLTSALSFFAATFGVGVYSDIDLISSMCGLLARGAVVSMLAVLLVLPSLLILLDGIITKTTLGMGQKNIKEA